MASRVHFLKAYGLKSSSDLVVRNLITFIYEKANSQSNNQREKVLYEHFHINELKHCYSLYTNRARFISIIDLSTELN